MSEEEPETPVVASRVDPDVLVARRTRASAPSRTETATPSGWSH